MTRAPSLPPAYRASLRRAGLGVVALTALAGSFAAGSAWHDEPQRSGRLVAAPNTPGHQRPGLVRAGSCDQLLDWYVDNSVDRVTAWGWDDVRVYAMEDSATARGDAQAPSTSEVTSSTTGTNVQEAGVDEPDVVKTDGSLLVRVDGGTLTTYDVTGPTPRRLGSLTLPGIHRDNGDGVAELLLVGDRAVVLNTDRQYFDSDDVRTIVRTVDLTDPDAPAVVAEQSYDAELLSARQYGDTVRLVVGSGLPDLDFVQPTDDRSEHEARAENRAIVRASTIDDWLPTVRDGDDDAEQLADCDAMRLPATFSGAGSVVVVGFDAADPATRSVTGVATASQTVYSSTDRLYLATSTVWGPACCVMVDGPGRFADTGTTDLHAFSLSDDDATYLGSGEVEGSVADRWAMDSADGVLRVAVGATGDTGNFNSVVTFAERDGALVELGRVDRIGVDEQIKAVRWFDDLAFVVTFRQTDPLYAVDLSDPAAPRVRGELKIPGFSEYLHPIGDDLLLGMGTAADLDGTTRGGQAAVFDVSDLSSPERVATHGYGTKRQTRAGMDPRQFTWLADRRTALTVVEQWGASGGSSAIVSILRVGKGGALTAERVHGAYGYEDVATLRTVPLPDGRVVLSSAERTEFLDV
ncbi:MAG: beta-propeller domain-containing protein [Nocardioides sp.]